MRSSSPGTGGMRSSLRSRRSMFRSSMRSSAVCWIMEQYGVMRSISAMVQWTMVEMMSGSYFSFSKMLVMRKTTRCLSRSYSSPPRFICLLARWRSSRRNESLTSSTGMDVSPTTLSAFS